MGKKKSSPGRISLLEFFPCPFLNDSTLTCSGLFDYTRRSRRSGAAQGRRNHSLASFARNLALCMQHFNNSRNACKVSFTHIARRNCSQQWLDCDVIWITVRKMWPARTFRCNTFEGWPVWATKGACFENGLLYFTSDCSSSRSRAIHLYAKSSIWRMAATLAEKNASNAFWSNAVVSASEWPSMLPNFAIDRPTGPSRCKYLRILGFMGSTRRHLRSIPDRRTAVARHHHHQLLKKEPTKRPCEIV